MKVEKYFVDIKNIIVNSDDYYAHRIDGNSQVEKEKLIEHIERCEKYFIRIFEEKEISDVVEKFEKIFFKTPEENKYYDKEVEFFRLALFNIITFHDIGKINPLFQSKKMENPKFAKEKKPDETLKSYHSELSSIIYIDYFESLLDSYELEKEIKKLMRIFILMFSFIISRHHSYLSNLDNYIRKFYDKDPKIEAEKKLLEELLENKIYVKNIEGSKFNDKIKVRYVNSFVRGYKKQLKEFNASIEIYTLSRLMYSMLVASDYYATTEYMNELEIRDLGNIKYFDEIYGSYKNGDIYKAINNYRNNRVDVKEVGKEGINILRSELFIDAEDELNKNKEKNIFYLEAPTGSGKSNTAMNLSFKLIENDKKLNKMFYIYPFNTLVEQNLESINKIFEGKENVMSQVAVVNSLFKLKNDKNYDGDSNEKLYESKRDIVTLLDRQFLNYPIILSTHVMLFKTLFGNKKEDAFAFHQLCNSVIVLDEIQSYKITIWSEIIRFLEAMSQMMNIKIIIMSATLPKLDMLLGENTKNNSENLIKNREKYFEHTVFKDRVIADYSLLSENEDIEEKLIEKILEYKDKKVLIEFITKKSAEEFYNKLKDLGKLEDTKLILITGNTSLSDRKKLIKYINNEEKIIVVATQVIEAGVDIDMDVGFKSISKLDSEEQLMGRINRSSKKENSKVYFFDYGDSKNVYKNDIRVDNKLTLHNDNMKEILSNKKFGKYYEDISRYLYKEGNRRNDENIDLFFYDLVGNLNMEKVSDRMELIDDNVEKVSLFLSREIELSNGDSLVGNQVWQEYKKLLEDNEMPYSTKKVKLHNIRTEMNEFIYEITLREFNECGVSYNDRVGNILYIEDCERFFEKGIFQKDALKENNLFF